MRVTPSQAQLPADKPAQRKKDDGEKLWPLAGIVDCAFLSNRYLTVAACEKEARYCEAPAPKFLFLSSTPQTVQLIPMFLKGDTMRNTTLLVICMCCLIAAPAVWGQAPNTQAKPGILGYLDPQTGAFRPVPQAAAEGEVLGPTATFTGTITVTLTITVKSAGITNVSCTANTSVTDNLISGSPVSFEESNIVAATGTGSSRKCVLTINYSWALATQTTDSMTTGYTVFGGMGTTGLPQRTATRVPLDVRKVPANGATTALTASVTL